MASESDCSSNSLALVQSASSLAPGSTPGSQIHNSTPFESLNPDVLRLIGDRLSSQDQMSFSRTCVAVRRTLLPLIFSHLHTPYTKRKEQAESGPPESLRPYATRLSAYGTYDLTKLEWCEFETILLRKELEKKIQDHRNEQRFMPNGAYEQIPKWAEVDYLFSKASKCQRLVIYSDGNLDYLQHVLRLATQVSSLRTITYNTFLPVGLPFILPSTVRTLEIDGSSNMIDYHQLGEEMARLSKINSIQFSDPEVDPSSLSIKFRGSMGILDVLWDRAQRLYGSSDASSEHPSGTRKLSVTLADLSTEVTLSEKQKSASLYYSDEQPMVEFSWTSLGEARAMGIDKTVIQLAKRRWPYPSPSPSLPSRIDGTWSS